MTSSVPSRHRLLLQCLCSGAIALAPAAALADEFQQDQQSVKLYVAVAGDRVTVDLRAPIEALLGFAHRPRTVAHFQAGQELLQRMHAPDGVLNLDPQAGCELTASTVEAPVLASAPAALASLAADAAMAPWYSADPASPRLDASFEYRCAHPNQLRRLDLALFEVFQRVERIDAHVAGPLLEEASHRLLRPQKTLHLAVPDAQPVGPQGRQRLLRTRRAAGRAG